MKRFIVGVLTAIVLAFSVPTAVKAWPAQDTVCLYYWQVNLNAAIEMMQLNDPAWFFWLQEQYFINNNFLVELYTTFPNESEDFYILMIDNQWDQALQFYCAYNPGT